MIYVMYKKKPLLEIKFLEFSDFKKMMQWAGEIYDDIRMLGTTNAEKEVVFGSLFSSSVKETTDHYLIDFFEKGEVVFFFDLLNLIKFCLFNRKPAG